MRFHVRGLKAASLIVASLAAGALGGCAGDSGAPGAPPARSLAAGQTCASVKADLARLDSKGVPGVIQSISAGKSVSPAQKADADLYNKLLNDYLGARCHVPPTQ